MILIIAAAILGAAVGLFVQLRLVALAVTLSLSGATHLMLGFVGRMVEKKPGHEILLRNLDLISGSDAHGIWPVMAAGGAGTILAAILWSLIQKQSTDVSWFLPSDGDRRHGVSSMNLVEDREVHGEARRRLNEMLDR